MTMKTSLKTIHQASPHLMRTLSQVDFDNNVILD